MDPITKERVKAELLDYIDEYGNRIFTVTQKSGFDSNGNRRTRAKFFIIFPDGVCHISYHVASLIGLSYSKKNGAANVYGFAHDAVKELNGVLKTRMLFHHELNG
jgi:hypothetical protein